MLAESINNSLDNKMNYEYNRHSKREKRTNNEIGIHSIRGGHIVLFILEKMKVWK